MGDNLREENARLKEQLHRISQVCELHRKLGEDTAFEIREVKRNLEMLKNRLEQAMLHFEDLTAKIAASGDEGMRMALELCTSALKGIQRLP